MARPFQITIADDEFAKAFASRLHQRCEEADIYYIDDIGPGGMVRQVLADGECESRSWNDAFLLSPDVLILDLAIRCSKKDWQDPECGTTYGGASFLRTQYANLKCQAVFIMTAFDKKTEAYVDHFTRENYAFPPVRKLTKSLADERRLLDAVGSLYDVYTEGFVELTDLGATEFAATHEHPVLIVGESGTGKESLAWQIHNRWAIEKARQENCPPGKYQFRPVNCAGLSAELARAELFGCVKGSFTGAEDHRLGECLMAAGLESFRSKQRLVPGEAVKTIEAAIAKLKEIGDATIEKDASWLQKEFLTLLRGDTTHASVFKAMESVLQGVQARASLDLGAEFRELLRAHNKDLVGEVAGLDINLSISSPRGTLFLDEFGDLDPSVQALLLRYLEKMEVKPVGYPGVIRNARVRIIAATSDPDVAEMVGEKLLSIRQGRRAERAGFREDLVFRLKGQVIRVTPVESDTVAVTLDRLLLAQGQHAWDGDAKAYIVSEVQRILAAMEHTQGSQTPSYVFGHRRELANLVALADSYLASAERRGIKGIGPLVTKQLVQHLWKPSRVSSTLVGLVPPMPANQTRNAQADSHDNGPDSEPLISGVAITGKHWNLAKRAYELVTNHENTSIGYATWFGAGDRKVPTGVQVVFDDPDFSGCDSIAVDIIRQTTVIYALSELKKHGKGYKEPVDKLAKILLKVGPSGEAKTRWEFELLRGEISRGKVIGHTGAGTRFRNGMHKGQTCAVTVNDLCHLAKELAQKTANSSKG